MTKLIENMITNKNLTHQEERQAYGMYCGGIGMFFNFLLFLGKLIAGIISHSIAITADAFNNLSDAASSVITLIGFRLAGQEADDDHPFGHGRIEYISGLFVAVLILFMGVELLKSSVSKILNPATLTVSPLILGILVVSILVKLYMYLFNRKIGRKISSSTILAAATDSVSDACSTLVILAATVAGQYTTIPVDGWCGLIVGVLICRAGVMAAKDTISPLLGQAPEESFVKEVNDIVMGHEEIIGIHDLIVHNYGPGRVLISLHAEVPADGDVLVLHDVIDSIEHELRDTLKCHAVIHMDPVCVGDEETERLKNLVNGFLMEISDELSMHDFRIVTGPTHTNLIFDVVTPYGFKLTDKELITTLTDMVRKDNPNFFLVVDIDKKMV
ncbi:MAG: cation transporter [Lachnospiraceae bacterium]|nr:cation transporter [Lachnospiraceae bacterium]